MKTLFNKLNAQRIASIKVSKDDIVVKKQNDPTPRSIYNKESLFPRLTDDNYTDLEKHMDALFEILGEPFVVYPDDYRIEIVEGL